MLQGAQGGRLSSSAHPRPNRQHVPCFLTQTAVVYFQRISPASVDCRGKQPSEVESATCPYR